MDLNAFEVYNGTEKHIEMQVLSFNTCSMVELMDIQRQSTSDSQSEMRSKTKQHRTKCLPESPVVCLWFVLTLAEPVRTTIECDVRIAHQQMTKSNIC